MGNTNKVTISLPQHLLNAVDDMAKERCVPRSSFIAQIIKAELEKIEEQSMIYGYTALAKENRTFAEDSFPLAKEAFPEWK